MQARQTVFITSVDDPVTTYLSGTDRDIPIVAFAADRYFDGPEITLHIHGADAVTWLRKFAAQVESLAQAVEQQAVSA